MFDSGASITELTDYFKRSNAGIAARLVRLGKIANRAELKQLKKTETTKHVFQTTNGSMIMLVYIT